MSMAPLTNEPSHGFHVAWGPTFSGGSCGSFTLDHFQLVLNDDHSPTSPTDGSMVINTGNHILDARPHRAQRTYYARLYACDNAACTDVFGDGAGESILRYSGCSDTCDAETAQEVWVIGGLRWSDESVLNSTGMTGPDVGSFWYPATSAWYPGYLALLRGNQLGDALYWYVASGEGWLDFNLTTSWDAIPGSPWSGSHDTDTDYDAVTHAFLYPVSDGSGFEIYMLAQNMGSTDQIVWGTVEDDPAPFLDITCASCCPGGTPGPCDWPDGESGGIAGVAFDNATYNLVNALHGRWMWNRIDYGLPDLSVDTPSILFTGSLDSPCTGSSPTQILQADWDPSSGWIPRDDDSDGCPDVLIDDAHDPGITPLPGGDFKIYVVNAAHDVETWYIHDGEIETQTATPLIQWAYGPPTTVSHSCVANLDPFAIVDENGPHEGMFLYVAQSNDGAFQSEDGCADQGGTDDGAISGTPVPGGIYFATLTN